MESLDLSLCHAFLESTRHFLGPDASECPALQQHHTLLCDQAQCQALKKLYESVVSKTGEVEIDELCPKFGLNYQDQQRHCFNNPFPC